MFNNRLLFLIFFVVVVFFNISLTGKNTAKKDGYYFPKLKPAKKNIKVIKVENLNDAEFLMIQTLIGITAKNIGAGILIDDSKGNKNSAVVVWMKELKKYGYSFEYINDPWLLLKNYLNISGVKGYTLCKLKTDTINISTSLAGILDAIAVDESIESKVKKFGLKKLIDVRDKSETWCFEKYKDKFNKIAADRVYKKSQHPSVYFLRDYLVATKGFCFWNSGLLRQKVLKWLGPDSHILGWGPGEEFEHVGNASLYGVMRLPSDWSLNMSFYAAVELPLEKIRYKYFSITNIKYNNFYKHYVCFLMTDGDNISWFQGNSFVGSGFWGSKYRGKFPLGWTVSSLFEELSPQIESYINRTKSNKEGFVAALSGNGYFYPDMYGKMVDTRKFETLKKSAENISYVFKRNRLEMLQIMDYNYDFSDIDYVDTYTKNIDSLLGLFWIKYDPYDAGEGAIKWGEDKRGHFVPLVSSRYIVWNDDTRPEFETPESAVRKILKLGYPPKEGLYTVISVHNWSWKEPLKEAYKIYSILKNNPSVKIVRPEELLIRLRLSKDPEGLILYFLHKYSPSNMFENNIEYKSIYKTTEKNVLKFLSEKKFKKAWENIKKLDRYYQKNS